MPLRYTTKNLEAWCLIYLLVTLPLGIGVTSACFHGAGAIAVTKLEFITLVKGQSIPKKGLLQKVNINDIDVSTAI